ncbi:MAG TPA: hypothetical protein PKC09_02865 [Paracoccus sp. (in: a-proteobacteria)]|nr:hypothetical protein [Paracoccus sp. (in: a-proteobacteria)]HMR37336.1 hypothetical protein [Paracoccus sp. (in: a-proteobacteria)]
MSRVHAAHMLEALCRLMIGPGYLDEVTNEVERSGLARALAEGDADLIYDHLMLSLSMQGISDDIAVRYIAHHGNATRSEIRAALARSRCACPKLAGFEAYSGCRYRKSAMSCARPQHLRLCPVRKPPLRKGLLNIQAHSLHFFLRDVCHDDVAGFIDQLIDGAVTGAGTGAARHCSGAEGTDAGVLLPDAVLAARDALLGEFTRVSGVSAKLANMVLADILLGGRPDDLRWRSIGAAMCTVDVLVHKFLDRTGILHEFALEHAYGPRCYRADGCDGVIAELARAVPVQEIHADYPAYFPRLVELAIWRFCAETEHGMCRARVVGKGRLCEQRHSCPVAQYCARGGARKRRRRKT